MICRSWLIVVSLIVGSIPAWGQTKVSAAQRGIFGGIGLLNQNAFFRVTDSSDASPSLLGPNYFPLQARTFVPVSNLLFSPRLAYTPLARKTADEAAEASILLLSLPFTFAMSQDGKWDWSAGLGYQIYTLKGKGGYKVLNNSTGTATFARPGRTSRANTLNIELGFGYNQNKWRYEVELFTNSLLGDKRNYSLFVSLNYRLGNWGGGL